MQSTLLAVFATSLALGVFAVIANVYVFLALRRMRVQLSFGLSGLPGYLTRQCRALTPSVQSARLLQVSRLSDFAFVVAILGAVATGLLLAGKS